MTELPDFETLLARLAANRNLVIDSEPPEPMVLRRLAPVLGLHTADLFVMAGMEVPTTSHPGTRRPVPSSTSWSGTP